MIPTRVGQLTVEQGFAYALVTLYTPTSGEGMFRFRSTSLFLSFALLHFLPAK